MKRLSRLSTAFLGAISCALLSTATSQSQCIKPPDGMVLWYPLDEKSSSLVAMDLISGRTSPLFPASGPIMSKAFVPGHDGGAFFFGSAHLNLYQPIPGTIGYFLAPSLAPNLEATDFGTDKNFSIDFWVYDMGCFAPPPGVKAAGKAASTAAVPCLVYWMGTGAQGKGWAVKTAWRDGNLALEIHRPPQDRLEVALGSFPLNTWAHLAITVDRTGPITSYLNGRVLMPANVSTGSIDLTSRRQLVIGGAYWDNGPTIPATPQGWARGYLDELEIYDRVLKPEEIADIYKKGKCKSKPKQGVTWIKKSSNAVNGTVVVGCLSPGCDPYQGDTLCSTPLPLLCFRPLNAPKPASTPITPFYYEWSGGLVGTTPPYPGSFASLAQANAACQNEFGPNWRVAEHHDGVGGGAADAGWNFHAYGNVGTSGKFWIQVKDQPNGTCWPNP